jgi:hypothetical protein
LLGFSGLLVFGVMIEWLNRSRHWKSTGCFAHP